MADIFLSYTRTDRDRVGPIVAVLESRGWSVWWDSRVDAGEQWDEVIEREIGAASCVVVVWSSQSVTSRWVRSEASEGLERGILVPVLIDATRPPLEFKLIQSVNLVGWSGDTGDPAAKALVCGVGRLVGRSALAATERSDLPQTSDHARFAEEQEHWELIRKGRDPRLLSDFLATYPDGRYARAAEARIQQLALRRADARKTAWAKLPGLVVATLFVVSATLWQTGWLRGPAAPGDQPRVQITEVRPIKPPMPVVTPKSRVDDVLDGAKRRIDSGDIRGARQILQASETARSASITFMLAETYDPNMLAAWETRGIKSDAAKARALYSKARDLGHPMAAQRLDLLKDPGTGAVARVALSAEKKAGPEKLVAKGRDSLYLGRIAEARIFFERAWLDGSAEGALRMAETYDPVELRRLPVWGSAFDNPSEARIWYRRAQEMGRPEAVERLSRLSES